MALFIGLMSGTSLDGVDGVLAELSEDDRRVQRLLTHRHLTMPVSLRDELLALNTSGSNEVHRAALATNALVALYAAVVDELLAHAALPSAAVAAIGAHGQTVRHRPGEFDGVGYTCQLFNGALLAERTGIDVVCDLRSADVAAHGQGAPLVPAFHAACFGRPGEDVAVLNVGGIANLTVLPGEGGVVGFDCGPGNVLLDLWALRHLGLRFDDGGRFAATGRVNAALLARMRADPFFAQPPPKSTGRDLFNAGWLEATLSAAGAPVGAADVMSTLLELTVGAASDAVRHLAPGCRELLVCGGGAANRELMSRLAAALPGISVASTMSAGVAPDHVEALAFAWLAACRLARVPASLPAVTGARGPRVLGALHAATRQ